MNEARVTVPALRRMKRAGEKIVMLTAYDFPFAHLLDASGIDVLLVGDSLGTVVQGHPTTLPVTLEEMIYHCRMVARASRRALVVGDMPFGSYQTGVDQALASACRLVKEGGAQAVKLEGGARVAEHVEAIARMDIPVMGHVGLTPQSINALGGFKVQRAEEQLVADAQAVQAAGASLLVIEAVPAELAARVSESLAIPTIGIGAGAACDGQVLVFHDLLGLFEGFRPKFVKRYAELGKLAREALKEYVADVRSGAFPGKEHTYK